MKLSTSEVTVVWEKLVGEKAGFGKTSVGRWHDVFKLIVQHNELFVPYCIIAGFKESQFYSLGKR